MKEPELHSSDLYAMTECALNALMPQFQGLPPPLRQWIKDGLAGEMYKAYQNSAYARNAMED